MVNFCELAGSPVEEYGPEGMRAQRNLACAWSQRSALVEELLGTGYEFGGRGRAEYPDRRYVVAMRVKIRPFVDRPNEAGQFNAVAEDLNTYELAELTVDYELLPFATLPQLPEPEADTFLTYRMDFGGEYQALPAYAFRWQDKPEERPSADVHLTQRIPIVEHHITWHRVSSPPWETIRDAIGTVNNASFMGAAAESVLLDGATADREFIFLDELAEPQFGWRLNYVFREKTIDLGGGNVGGWNHRYRALPKDDPAWDRPELADGGALLYPQRDFTPLFRFAVVV
jgi:hypothetical protein